MRNKLRPKQARRHRYAHPFGLENDSPKGCQRRGAGAWACSRESLSVDSLVEDVIFLFSVIIFKPRKQTTDGRKLLPLVGHFLEAKRSGFSRPTKEVSRRGASRGYFSSILDYFLNKKTKENIILEEKMAGERSASLVLSVPRGAAVSSKR